MAIPDAEDIPAAAGWLVRLAGLLFLLSGATSLAYQVAWTRILSLFFGSDVYAAAITLSVFMGGLSLGSWIAGRWGDWLKRPLLVYGVCEIAIAVAAYLFPFFLSGFEGIYQDIYRDRFDAQPGLYHGFRLTVAASVLTVPTLLMGATLPLIVRRFANTPHILGRRVGAFYAINTLGALSGTLIAGFALLPRLGVIQTVMVAIVVNLVIGIIAVIAGWRSPGESLVAAIERGRGSSLAPMTGLRRAVIMTMGLSGLAALALEVVWMRVLVQSFSATVYAFSIMLSCFLFGIFYGSRKVSKNLDGHANPKDLLVTLELWLGGAVALLAVLAYVVPGLFGGVVWGLTGITGGDFGIASVVAQFVIAFLLIVVPTVMLGATFPVAVKVYTDDVSRRARGTGVIYAANTAGAMVGAMGAGFVLLPVFGTRISLLVIAGVFIAAGAYLARSGEGGGLGFLKKPQGASALGLAVASTVAAFMLPPQTVVNFNLQRTTQPNVVFHGEGIAQTVDIIKSDAGHTILMINGNIEADTTLLQRRHFILKAHLPLLLHPDPKDVAVVGLGLGITLAATVRHPTVENIRLVELSPEMVKAHAFIKDVTGGVLDSPKVNLRIDDGRNFMAMTDETFDMITADPVHPRITGVGYLYTREYYQQIKQRLRPGGVVTQWMPMYRISRQSFDTAFRTFVDVFPHASFWYVRGHGLFVSTLDGRAIDYPSLAARFNNPAVRKDLTSIGIETPEALLGHMMMDAKEIGEYLARNDDRTINTDDNAYLEYKTPFEYIEKTEAIVEALLPFAGWNVEERLKNAPQGVKTEVRRQFKYRRGRIRTELTEPIN